MPRHGPGLGRGFGRIELQYLGWFSSLVPTLHWIESPWFACPLGLAGLSVGGLLNGSPAVIVIRHVSSFSVAKIRVGGTTRLGKQILKFSLCRSTHSVDFVWSDSARSLAKKQLHLTAFPPPSTRRAYLSKTIGTKDVSLVDPSLHVPCLSIL